MIHKYDPPQLNYIDSQLSIDERYNEIKSMLNDYECMIDFVKVNGETRSMKCTLREDLMTIGNTFIKEDISEAETNLNIITVWSTENNAWRAMRTMNIQKVSIAPKSWTVTVEEDPETGDTILQLPEELIQLQGWKEGDVINWENQDDGSWSISKKEEK